MKTLIFVLLTVSALYSHAAHDRAREVARVYYSAKCDQGCQQGIQLEYYESKDLLQLPLQLYKSLEKVAYDQAQIWGDTILEGEYTADGATKLDAIMIIRQDARVIGYTITYSERAWYVGDCLYVHHNPATLASCEEGRIRETSFVDPNLREAQVDQNQFAEFEPLSRP